MSQQIINLGVGPDSQTGDSLYVAFTKVNDNFTELYSVFDGNAITAVNANVVYTNNVVTSANVRSGNIFTYGNIESIGYVITSGVFYPNGVPLGSLSAITTNLIPLTSNIYTVGNVTNQFTEGYFSSNITLSGSNVTVRNGVLYIDGDLAEANYSNANVANYLPIYGGNIAATVTTSSQPYITELGTLTSLNVDGNTIISGNLDVSGTITYLNVRDFSVQDPIITLNTGPNGAPLISNNSFDSGVRTYYFDTENRAAFFGRASDTGYFEYYSNVQSEVGNIISGTYGTVKTGNIVLTGEANLAGNITSNYFLGNGRYLTGIDTTLISNETSNVKVYANGNIAISSDGISNVAVFTSIGGNVSGDFFITGTIKALNYIGNVQGNLSAPGLNTQVLFNDNDTAGAAPGLTFNKITNVLTVSNSIVTTGNVTVGGYTVIDSSGNIVTSRLVNSGVVAGTYGNASAVPVITVDTKGRITVANTTAVAGVNNVTYDSSTGNLTVFTSAGTNYSIDTGVGTSDSPVFAGLSAAGNASVNALTINNSATIGSTLGVVGNVNAGQINVAGYNVIDSTGNVVTSRLIDSGVTAGTYGNASAVPVITVDTKGRITVANTTAVAGVNNVTYDVATGNLTVFTSAGTTFSVDTNVGTSDSPVFAGLSVAGNTSIDALTINNSATIGTTLGVVGNVNAGQINVAGYNVIDSTGNVVTSRLIDSGVTAGTYGNASAVPVITVDAKGRITVANTTAVAGVNNVTYDSSTGNLTVFTSAGTTFSVDTNVGTSDSPVFAGLSVAGNASVNALTINNSATIGGTLGVTGNLIAGNLNATNFIGNAITLGSNTAGQLVSNAVTLTSSTSITNSIAQLNYVLGKLVPLAPNNFPGSQSLTISTLSTYRMCNFTQTDNTVGANKSVAGGTSISNVRRATTYTTSTIANVGPGESGTVTAYRNGVAVGNVALISGNVSGTYGNLVITRSGDYANVSNVTPGFWYSFSSSLSGNVPAGWNEVYIVHSAAGGTNTPYWYYDSSAPGTPTWSNTSIALTTNSSTYSSTIPHLNSSSQFTLYGNVNKLSGDMFPSGASSSAYAFVTGTAGGALAAPSSVTYAGAGVTWPLAQNLYVSSGSAYLSTTAAVVSGFGSSSSGPSLTADNSYATGSASFAPGVTVLYKTGTSTQIEETSITVTSVGTGSGNALRVINPGSADTPAITANTAFNSQTSTLQTYDATVVAAVLKHDQTNYSTGYLPVGPNLSSGRTGAQYFTFRFTRTQVSKFNISITGNVGNVWVALPGSTLDSTSTLNGWIDMGTAYSGSGAPGANVSAGGNGSNGCALGGIFTSNSSGTQSKTCTFGTVSSSSTATNEIFVRLKLYAGQTVTALSIIAATN